MSMFTDSLAAISGKDLPEDKTSKKKSGKKVKGKNPEPAKKKSVESKGNASTEAILGAYDYAKNANQLSKDVCAALKEGCLSDNLSKLLQVMFDKSAVRDLVSAQGDVRPAKPGPDEYELKFRFVHPETGDWCSLQAQSLLKNGTSFDQLEDFNIALRVVHRLKLTGEEVAEGSDEDYAEIQKRIEDGDFTGLQLETD